MDAYNANPTSMRAALENFASAAKGRGPNWPYLATCSNWVKASRGEHAAIVTLLGSLKLDAWLIGPEFSEAAVNDPFVRFDERK